MISPVNMKSYFLLLLLLLTLSCSATTTTTTTGASNAGNTLAIRVEESSRSPSHLAIRFLNLDARTEIVAVDVARVGSQNWNFMDRGGGEGGAIWETNRVPAGPLQFRVVVTAGMEGKWYWATKVMPEDWKCGEVYDTGLRITDTAMASSAYDDKML
ncbi:unnamed protein product [Cuscuta campestris]|uniref:Expansin-like CBD domain-containing protein n=1 Tax=Cuscuta campestris TaxID=132261 RepID=A0A484KZ38_9ASTE|nr:unnamed protein product [Cuscuta campestris]